MKPTLSLLMCLLAWTLSSGADERILNYHSRIEVQANADLLITETITVQAEGREIKRGIFRDFPTDYKDRLGNRYVVDFVVKDVLRDGKPEAFHTQKQENGTRVYVGKESVFLDSGLYTYTLKFRTNYQLGFFDQHDELYFNAIGTGWAFPIDRASIEVILPQTVPNQDIQAEGYTGGQGSKETDLQVVSIEDATVHFDVTRPLNAYEGVSVVVMWPKGHVQEPAEARSLGRTMKNNSSLFLGSVGFILVGAYFLIAWMLVGRDPEKGVIIPEFKPPENLSPAGARFLLFMKYDHRCFAAALINLAVKGYIELEEVKKKYTVHRKRETADGLSKGEARIFKSLVGSRKSIELKQTNHSKIGQAVDRLKKAMKDEYEGTCFKRNMGWLIPGFLLTLLTIAGIFLFSGQPEGAFLGLWLSFWSIGVYFLARQVYTAWTMPGKGPGEYGGAVFITLFSLPFLAGEIGVTYFISTMIPPLALVLVILLIGMNGLFYHLIKQPTYMGRKLMDQLEGFKLYLSVAEEENFQAMQGPAKTPELFEAYLPYALALGVEQEWSEKFSAVLEAAGQASGDAGYRPMWHHGSVGRFDTAAFAGGLGGALASAVASSSTAPGSSSGGGGGGFSGGGGGGGGGGGW